MENSKKLLNILMGVSFVLLSLSVLIYSIKSNPVNAQPSSSVSNNSYKVVGVVSYKSTNTDKNFFNIAIIGYNEKTKDIKVLSSKDDF